MLFGVNGQSESPFSAPNPAHVPLMSELRKCTKRATAEQPHMEKGKIAMPMIGLLEINTAPDPATKLGMTWFGST
jgi:hypothetical protein